MTVQASVLLVQRGQYQTITQEIPSSILIEGKFDLLIYIFLIFSMEAFNANIARVI